jgi:host factor-I protein
VTFFLVNGFKLNGLVRGFDSFTVILESEGKQKLIYKHAISTIDPLRNVSTAISEDLDGRGAKVDARGAKLEVRK